MFTDGPIRQGAIYFLQSASRHQSMLGELTPPFGMVLFALMRVTGFSLNRVVRAALPFYVPVTVVVVLIALFPSLVTWLPRMLVN